MIMTTVFLLFGFFYFFFSSFGDLSEIVRDFDVLAWKKQSSEENFYAVKTFQTCNCQFINATRDEYVIRCD